MKTKAVETVTQTYRLPREIRAQLRASHAGEFGAVWIYRGILLVNTLRGDKALASFAKEHMATEKEHLAAYEEIIHEYRGSFLLLLWAVAGFLTGALPALFGRNWVYYTIFCVESFVDKHYREQLQMFDVQNAPLIVSFRASMRSFHADEVHHRDEALSAMSRRPSALMRLWGKLIGMGSSVAVKIAQVI
jgi:ubiquinone biosynthesis monooxygenase Coq7